MEYDLSSAGSLISELRHAASVNFISVRFAFVPRTCNKLADALAVLGSSCDVEIETVLSVLPAVCIRDMVANDLAPVE